jgi:hypothetical protein
MHLEMAKARNLDVFYDVVFELRNEADPLSGSHLMRANKAVLEARS